MNEFHEANRKGWNAAVRAGLGQVDNTKDWRECYRDASQIFYKNELKWFSDTSGKKVCVLGSGDTLDVRLLFGIKVE